MHTEIEAYLCDGHTTIKLDQVVKVAKKHGDWNEANVSRVAKQVWKQLDCLREHEVPKEQSPEYRALPLFNTSLILVVCRVISGLG